MARPSSWRPLPWLPRASGRSSWFSYMRAVKGEPPQGALRVRGAAGIGTSSTWCGGSLVVSIYVWGGWGAPIHGDGELRRWRWRSSGPVPAGGAAACCRDRASRRHAAHAGSICAWSATGGGFHSDVGPSSGRRDRSPGLARGWVIMLGAGDHRVELAGLPRQGGLFQLSPSARGGSK